MTAISDVEGDSRLPLSAVVGVSVLAHMAAIGALVMLEPMPHSVPTVEMIEVSLVPQQALSSPRANNASGAIANASAVAPLLSLDATALGSPPNWSSSLNISRSFDMPGLPAFKQRTHTRAFDTLATMLDCLAVGGSTREASGSSRRTHPPCTSDDPLLRGPVMTLLPTYASQPGSTDNLYRTFKSSQSVFDESLFPDEVPPAIRALENWIIGLFR